jgi:hypothetical protein
MSEDEAQAYRTAQITTFGATDADIVSVRGGSSAWPLNSERPHDLRRSASRLFPQTDPIVTFVSLANT